MLEENVKRKIVKAVLHFVAVCFYRTKKIGAENIPAERKIYIVW